MRTVAILPMVFAALCPRPARPAADPKGETGPPASVGRLPREWSLKIKGDRPPVGDGVDEFGRACKDVKILFEFDQDAANLKLLRAGFVSDADSVRLDPREKPAADPKEPPAPRVLLYLFDEDNIVVDKIRVAYVQGEITGKEGDAFRVTFRCPLDDYKRAKKMEMRLSEVEK